MVPAKRTTRPASPLRSALRHCRPHLIAAAGFSAGINLLNLTPTIYMMQVYDRVLPTGHVPTLVMLSLIALGSLATLALFDWLRARVLVRSSARLDTLLSRDLLDTLLTRPGLSRLDRAEGMRQLDTLRQGLGGPVIVAAFDLPWAPLFILVAFLLHPLLGGLALAGCVLLLGFAWSNERAVHGRTRAAEHSAAVANAAHAHVSSFAAEVRAMGMHDALVVRQLRERGEAKDHQIAASFAATTHSGLVRFTRLALQSAATGLGAWLAVAGLISPGAVIAASFLFARAMAPIDQIVGGWRGLVAAHDAWRRLDALLADLPLRDQTLLPPPTGTVAVERLTVLAPNSERIALSDVNFAIRPGEQIGVVGQSGSGKSTLLRTLAGALLPVRGAVRYDGVAYDNWMPGQITRAIGYLPQEFVLFPGTVKENISRFDGELHVDAAEIDRRVVAAAMAVGVHDTIARLPDGYGTRIGVGGVGLSAGQTQRIALARALYGEPRVLILDEPNAHLDAQSEYLLIRLLSSLRAKGTTVIMAAHSGDVLASMDKLLQLKGGGVVSFGPLTATPALRGPVPAPVSAAATKDA